MEKNCNIFIVHTEYHVLITVNIISNIYQNCINRVYWTPSSRMSQIKTITINDMSFHSLPPDYGNKSVLGELLSYKPKSFFFFQDGNVNNLYLCNRLAKSGVRTALVQDGLKPYVGWKKKNKAIITMVNTVKMQLCLLHRHILCLSMGMMDIYDYGAQRYIDELWLTNPEVFNNKHNKALFQIPHFSQQAIDLCNRLFDDYGTDKFNSIVLILGQPTINSQNWAFDTMLVERIIKRFPDHTVLYKPHPSTNPEHLQMIRALKYDNFRFYSKKVPVELLILLLVDSVIISRNSTGMLTENRSCKYYWTHKMFPLDILSSQYVINNPTNHIKEIDSIDEIVF